MIDYAFRPAAYAARVGDTVVWANDGLAPHTATATNGAFDTGIVGAGASGSVRLTTAGTFSYFCTIHPQMTGTLTVAEAPAGAVVPDDAATASDLPLLKFDFPLDGAADVDAPVAAGAEVAPATAEIDVIEFDYDPDPVIVEVGTVVIWNWVGEVPHTVTDTAGGFDSGIVNPGETWSMTVDEVGRLNYFCTLHPGMDGIVEVVAAEAPAPEDRDAASPAAPEVDPPTRAAALPAPSLDRSSDLWKGLVGGGVFLFAGAVFLLTTVRFMRWAASEEAGSG